jgi:predicted  nucleic acid-binding Zn-ribbon protein
MSSSENKKGESSKCNLARFGNKKVIKYSDEYHHQRLKNNESVKNSRLKSKQKQKETESRMNKLADENRTLNERVDSLMKELQVLRSLYKELGQDLPADAVKALEQINIY